MSTRELREIEARLNQAIRDIEGATKESIRDAAMDLWSKSADLVPVLDGHLKGSGKAEPKNDGMVWEVSYGTEYAHYQHEGLDFRHPQGGQAKYLQQPFEENADRYIQKIRDSVRRET